jgi:hypothetical protein
MEASMDRAHGQSKILVFLFAYSLIALALYTAVTMGSPALGVLLGG